MGEVRARVGCINCRRSSAKVDWLVRSRYWPNRRPYLVKALKEVDASIYGTQECTRDQAHDIVHDLGPNFTYFGGDGPGNGPVIWDGLKWDAVDAFEQEIEAPGDRYIVGVQLASRPPKNPGRIWIITCHLTVGGTQTAIDYRHKQIRAVIRELQHHNDWQHSVICGDFNSDGYNNGYPTLGGVRTIAAELGFRDLRTVLRNGEVTRYNYSSANNWKEPTPKTGRWIDDVLTPHSVKPLTASIEFTHHPDWKYWGSDHNIVRASVAWDNEEALH